MPSRFRCVLRESWFGVLQNTKIAHYKNWKTHFLDHSPVFVCGAVINVFMALRLNNALSFAQEDIFHMKFPLKLRSIEIQLRCAIAILPPQKLHSPTPLPHQSRRIASPSDQISAIRRFTT